MVKIRIESDKQVEVDEKANAVIAFVYAPESMEEADDDRTATQVVMQGQGNHMRMLMDAATGLSSLVDTAVSDPIDQMMLRALMMKKIQESAKKSAEVVVQKAESNKVVPDTMKNEGRAPWNA